MVGTRMKHSVCGLLIIVVMILITACAGTESVQEDTEVFPKKSESVNYTVDEKFCAVDGQELYGVLYKPEGNDKVPLIIFSHELGCTHSTGLDYAEYYAEKGIAVYLFDFRGGGYGSRSGNDMSKMSVMTEKEDMLAVYDEAKTWDFVDEEKIVFLGASQGDMLLR